MKATAKMDDNIWQWLVGIVAGGWLTAQSFISRRLHLRIDKLEDGKADGPNIEQRLTSINDKVERHDQRNFDSHEKLFDQLAEQKSDLARIEGKVDSLCDT